MRQGQLLATGLIYTRQKYIVLDETQKSTKTDSQLPTDPDPGASLTALICFAPRIMLATKVRYMQFPSYWCKATWQLISKQKSVSDCHISSAGIFFQ